MIENPYFSNSLSDQALEQGIAGFPKDATQRGERPMQGRESEAWMASLVHVTPDAKNSTPREELSADDKRLMTALKYEWKALKGKYKAPIEHALDEMEKALMGGIPSIDILAGYSKTGAPLLDPSKAITMLDEIRKSIETNVLLSERLTCGETYLKDKYRRFTVTIKDVGV